ncbi:hypothetical protein NDA13_000869 [Ustilago tritici]|nr:hypothetical protein NDA13_000869 [Ustilago tritici]
MANLKLASMFTVATWNCASLNFDKHIATLHDHLQSIGKANSVLLQEMRLASPESLPRLNPLLRIHHPFATQAHQAVLGADWNAVHSLLLDTFPGNPTSAQVPHGLLARAGLVNVYHTLHPTGTVYTCYTKLHNILLLACCIYGISVSHMLVPHLKTIETCPSLSDHSIITIKLASNAPWDNLGLAES